MPLGGRIESAQAYACTCNRLVFLDVGLWSLSGGAYPSDYVASPAEETQCVTMDHK